MEYAPHSSCIVPHFLYQKYVSGYEMNLPVSLATLITFNTFNHWWLAVCAKCIIACILKKT